MKGLYLVRQDEEMIERAIAAGIDTLLVPFYDIPGRAPSGLDTFEENVRICAKFAPQATIIAVPVMFPHWCDVPQGQQFIHNGVALPKHFFQKLAMV